MESVALGVHEMMSLKGYYWRFTFSLDTLLPNPEYE